MQRVICYIRVDNDCNSPWQDGYRIGHQLPNTVFQSVVQVWIHTNFWRISSSFSSRTLRNFSIVLVGLFFDFCFDTLDFVLLFFAWPFKKRENVNCIAVTFKFCSFSKNFAFQKYETSKFPFFRWWNISQFCYISPDHQITYHLLYRRCIITIQLCVLLLSNN